MRERGSCHSVTVGGRGATSIFLITRGGGGGEKERGEEVSRVEVPTTQLWLRPELAGRWSPVGDGGERGGVVFFFEEKLEGHWVASVDPPFSPM